MVFLPQFCQTIFCVLYPAASLIISPVVPSTIDLLSGKFLSHPAEIKFLPTESTIQTQLPFKLNRPFSIRPQFLVVKPTSFAENLINKLSIKNTVLNGTMGQLNNVEPTPTKISGAGTESKFPQFFEGFVQRVQSLFSVYKYPDLSRPGNAVVSHPVLFSRPNLMQRPLQTTIKPEISTFDMINDDYNEVLGSDISVNESIQDIIANMGNTSTNEEDIINVGEDDEPGLELRLNVKKL